MSDEPVPGCPLHYYVTKWGCNCNVNIVKMPISRSRSKSPARTPKRSPARSPTRSPTRSPKKVTASTASDDSEFARSLLGFAVGTIVFAATLSFGLVTSAMLPAQYRGVDVVAHQEQLEAAVVMGFVFHHDCIKFYLLKENESLYFEGKETAFKFQVV